MSNSDSLANISNSDDFSYQKEIIPTLMKQLFPICRSITGFGVRKSLNILKEISDFKIFEIPSGTKCFDWTVPDEWNIKDAFIEDSKGNKIIDFQKNNLHVVNYSIPIDETLTFTKLKNHLYTLPNIPDAIPYRTSYYKREWGFCLEQNKFEKMDHDTEYHVVINSSLSKGSMTLGEYLIKGESKNEFIFSTYCCHPSMANDNLSGMILWILLLQYLKSKNTKFSYRFLIMPETIGTISYLSKNQFTMSNVIGGFVLTCVGGPGDISYKSTFLETHPIDKIVTDTLDDNNIKFKKFPFVPRGSDERQFSSPGFRIPIGLICKDKFHEYENYHTSLDNLEFISESSILSIFSLYVKIIDALEQSNDLIFHKDNKKIKNKKTNFPIFKSLNPNCEPMLSKRNLYPTIGGTLKQSMSKDELVSNNKINLDLLLNILFYSDGNTSVEYISLKSRISEDEIFIYSKYLVKLKLLEENV